MKKDRSHRSPKKPSKKHLALVRELARIKAFCRVSDYTIATHLSNITDFKRWLGRSHKLGYHLQLIDPKWQCFHRKNVRWILAPFQYYVKFDLDRASLDRQEKEYQDTMECIRKSVESFSDRELHDIFDRFDLL